MKTKIGSALVVGAGISGIRSALDLAEVGYQVTLIDKAPHLGGTLAQLDYQFPSDHCGMCKMLPLIERDAASQYCLRKGLFHENIDIKLATELVAMGGEPGKFQVTLRQKPTLVDAERCIGCGLCAEICPVEVPDPFNAGLTLRKAVYLPVPHNIPNHYVVDTAACTRCGECEQVCPSSAIDLQLEARRTFRILVVDDELVVRDSIKEWLADEGFSVDMAESGFEALEKLADQDYNLLLLDVKMPGMDGVEVLKQAKEIRPDLAVVMMTAYATVETAVEAMKIGARDYLMKPFDPELLVEMVVQRYRTFENIGEQHLEVGAVILSTGFGSFDPASGNNTYGYGELPNVVTSLEFERLLSGTGPNQGRLLRPSDGQPVQRVAWLQCVGSRDMHHDADYCSSVCCMFSIKEALLAKEHSGGAVDTTIFYMDMRTFGKDFQRYRERAEQEHGVSFVRSRVHTVEPEGGDGRLRLRYTDLSGAMQDESFDLVVLATGQRPAPGTAAMAEMLGLDLNTWGFCQTKDISPCRSTREGVLLGGSFAGLKDIAESVIQASSAAVAASALIHGKGGSLAEVAPQTDSAATQPRDVSRELPRVAVALCTCGKALAEQVSVKTLTTSLRQLGGVSEIVQIERICTRDGWEELHQALRSSRVNRVLIGACMPYLYGRKLRELGAAIGLQPSLIEVVDIRTAFFPNRDRNRGQVNRDVGTLLNMGISKLKGMEPVPQVTGEIMQKALVVGAGIAGMTAALAIADHGYGVDLVEQADAPGGNLRALHRTLAGYSPQELLEQTIAKINKHPHIQLHTQARVIHSQGQIGGFVTTIETADGSGQTLQHGVTVLATGGQEAKPDGYAYGQHAAIVTQHELEERLNAATIKPAELQSVVMIQCVGSREEPRNYCSRVCCAAALKNALFLKEQNPEIDIYILYRDLMAYGFIESSYTKARQAGIIFVQYQVQDKPRVTAENGQITVSTTDPILGRELVLRSDLLVLSTGIVPAADHARLAELFGIGVNADGFYQEAESKWRPLDFIKEGIFMCGIAHAPHSIAESIATAEAAAQRCLEVLSKKRVTVDGIIAEVRHSLCALCERCLEACPYGARWHDEEEEKILINPLMCQGCGSCAAVCPNSASVLRGYKDQQLLEVIDAALDEII